MSPFAERRRKYEWWFNRLLHIRPWEIDLLTVAQFEHGTRIVDAAIAEGASLTFDDNPGGMSL